MKPNEAISIRPQQIKDAGAFFRILQAGEFKFFPVNIASIEAEKRFLRSSISSFKAGKAYNFAILRDSQVVGAVGIMPENGRNYNAEIGYFIDKEFHGQGIALQAVKLAEEYALNNVSSIKRLQALIVVDNVPSIKVAEKAGFTREGRLKSYLKVGEKYCDAFIYGKVLR